MIITIFGFIVHLETQMKLILEMMKERWTGHSLEEDFYTDTLKDLEKSLDKIDHK